MPLLLAIGHVTRDRLGSGETLGGSVSYAALAARQLGWDAAVVTRAGADFDPERELPGVRVVCGRGSATTRFVNEYLDGQRHQRVLARAEALDESLVPTDLRAPDALLLAPVAGEIEKPLAARFEAGLVGVIAQGWMREIDDDGRVRRRHWPEAALHLGGADVLFVSEHDLPGGLTEAAALRAHVPLVIVTRGRRGAELFTADGRVPMAAFLREETDPTGAGDVFAAAFVVRYHECGDPVEAAAFAACAASCVVEGLGASALGDRAEVRRRQALWERTRDEHR